MTPTAIALPIPHIRSAIAALCLLAASACPAQSPAPQPPTGAAVEFSDELFRLDTVGLTLMLPSDVSAQSTTVGSKSGVQIQPREPSWIVNIQTPKTANPDTTTAQAVDEIATQVLRESGEAWAKDPAGGKPSLVGYNGEIIEPRKTILINGLPAERVYVKVPGEREGFVVRGFTVFKTTPAQFVTFELISPEAGFARARSIYETFVGTATFEDPSRVGADRAAAVTAGLKVFERAGEAELREVIEQVPERWERFYRPAATGADSDATELGYRRLRFSVGTRAALGATGHAGSRDPGFVAQLDARYLDGARVVDGKLVAGRVVDSRSVYFMSFDRADEAWTVQNAVRAGTPSGKSQPKVFTETGGRTGRSMFVSITGPGTPGRDVRPVFQGDGYVSRFESLLLPEILIRAGVQADLGFYTYQSSAETIKLRRDLLEQPSEMLGAWRLTTRLTEDKPAQVSVYNDKGRLVKTELADGTLWEPIELDRLVSLWRSKGLPMD
ncbi:MAG: hypothetical protein WAZ94_05995 [Phycisphaerales bacterium]